MKLTWLGHASVQLLIGNRFVYVDPVVDPFQLWQFPKAELILLSSTAPDHFSEECVRELLGDVGVVYGPSDAGRFLQVNAAQEREVYDVGFCTVKTMPANPVRKDKARSIGFLLRGEGKTVYYSGDTKYIAEMEGLCPDVLLIPIGGTYSVSAQEAASWLVRIKPKIVIPIHWGRNEGTLDDAYRFIREAPVLYQNRIRILQEGESINVDEVLKTF